MGQLLTMSHNELKRIEVMKKLVSKQLYETEAANYLDLSVRQVRRLKAAYMGQGTNGIISKKRSAPGNHRYPDAFKETVLAIVESNYHDFKPTFAAEKLAENHHISVSRETLRKWMIEAGLWKTRAQRLKRAYQPRYRRDCYGELIQIDGSHHPWFEDRAPKCTLLVYIDDATGQLMELHFTQSESTFSYFKATNNYLEKHGKPVAFYSDKHSTFRINKKGEHGGDGVTQFGRALSELNIDIICANSCQAKGRVERANLTLQDRLVKELRLHNISTVEEANIYADEFIKGFNHRFGKPAISEHNAHRPLIASEKLDDIFCCQEERTLSNSLTLQYDRVIYMIEDTPLTRKLRRKRVTVYDYYDGSIKLCYRNTELPYRIFDRLTQVNQATIVDNKRLGRVLEYIQEKQAENAYTRSASTPSRKHSGKESAVDKNDKSKKYHRILKT